MMLDRPEGWQIVALLAPIALVMNWIRVRELRASSTMYEELSDPQKVWLVCLALSPGASARLLSALEEGELRECLEQSRSLRGTGQLLVPRVLRELAGQLVEGPGKAKDADEIATALSRQVEVAPEAMAEALRLVWSFRPPPAPVVPEPVVEPVVEAPPPEPDAP